MSLTSKSPRTVILVALAVGRKSLADHAHRCSPKVFTQPQLFACLALMAFLRTDYRGIEQHLRDCPYWQQLIGLKRVPDHATLHRAARRFFATSNAERILATTIALMKRRQRGPSIVHLAAADSTGLETGHRSAYFVRRKARGQKHAKNPLYQTTSYTRFPKLSILIDCDHHLILALLTNTGPKPDINELDGLLSRLPADVTLHKLVADAGYDSEPNHELLRDHHGIRSVMPATHGRPTKNGKQLSGRYRRLMQSRLRTKRGRQRSGYTQRWQVETVMSMIKRNLGEELSGKSFHARNRQMRMLAVVHNIMVTRRWGGLRQSSTATIMQHNHDHSPTHFGVSVSEGQHTHLHAAPDIIPSVVTAAEHSPGAAIASVTMPIDATSAAARQAELLGQRYLGPYNQPANSCVTHVCDVLKAGGVNVPAPVGKDQARYLIRLLKQCESKQ